MKLTDVYQYSILQQYNQYTFFSAAHGNFSKTDNMLEHKANLNKYNKTKITHCILSNLIKLEPNNKSNSRKYTNNWR
jgi:hypothetical protein